MRRPSGVGFWSPQREFLHVDDLADAVIFATRHYDGESHLNVGTGKDISIAELVSVIADVVGWEGEAVFDPNMPDGTPRKLLDVSALADLGWTAQTGLRDGIAETYAWFLDNVESVTASA